MAGGAKDENVRDPIKEEEGMKSKSMRGEEDKPFTEKVKEQASNLGQKAQEGFEKVKENVNPEAFKEQASKLSQKMSEGFQKVKETIKEATGSKDESKK